MDKLLIGLLRLCIPPDGGFPVGRLPVLAVEPATNREHATLLGEGGVLKWQRVVRGRCSGEEEPGPLGDGFRGGAPRNVRRDRVRAQK